MSPKSLFSYSFQSFYLAGSFLLLFVLLPSFYNLSLEFVLSSLGAIILISRIIDIGTDVLIGYITEKRLIQGKSKKNQILFGIIIFIISLHGLYILQPTSKFLFFLYYNLALVSYSIIIIPYDSIIIDLKNKLNARFRITTIKEIFTVVGVLVALIMPTAISELFSVDLLNSIVIYYTGILLISFSIIGYLLFFLFYEEEKNYSSTLFSINEIINKIKLNKRIIPLAFITFFNLLANNFTANLFIIFVTDFLNIPEYAGYLLILYFLITLIFTPLWFYFGKSYSNIYLLQVGTMITLVGFAMVGVTEASSWKLYLIVVLITGIGVGVDLIIPQIELADILDDNSDNRLSQTFTALFSIIKKAAIGIAAGIALTGYGLLQNHEISVFFNIASIKIFYFFIPFCLKFLVLFMVIRYRNRFHVSPRR